jgi:isoleucyl-tRNA synthetase
VVAPLLPLTSEAIWGGLHAAGHQPSSVHLAPWPEVESLPHDPGLVRAMDQVREVCSAAHSVRKAQKLRARLPLASLTVVATEAARLAPFVDLITEEVNVKRVELDDDVDAFASRTLSVNFSVAAPRLGKDTPLVAAAAKRGDWELLADGRARVGEATLNAHEFTLKLKPLDEATTRALPGQTGLVVLDTEPDPLLEAEGLARDVLRTVQQTRRQQALEVGDRIRLTIRSTSSVIAALETHRSWLGDAALAVSIDLEVLPDGTGSEGGPALADGSPLVIVIGPEGPGPA